MVSGEGVANINASMLLAAAVVLAAIAQLIGLIAIVFLARTLREASARIVTLTRALSPEPGGAQIHNEAASPSAEPRP